MKILKKFLLVFCFSIFLFGFTKVKAINFDSANLTALDNYINNGGSIEKLQELIKEKYNLDSMLSDEDYYIVSLSEWESYNNKLRLLFFKGSSDVFKYALNYTNYYMLQLRGGYLREYDVITFNSNWDDFSISHYENWTQYYENIGATTWGIIFTPIFTNMENISYSSNANGYTSPISFNSGQSYNFNSDVPIDELKNINYNYELVPYNFEQNPEPILYTPQIEHFDGYDKVTYYIDNFTIESNEAGYQILIKNNTNGTIDNIPPDVNNINQVIVKEYYENSNITFGLYQWNPDEQQLDEIVYWNINTNIDYEDNQDYSIKINSVSNSQKIVYYDYLINNNNSVKCYYSINNNNFIEDTGCTDQSNTYSLQLNNNGNITWEIRDLQNNILYTYSQNFIFSVGSPFINFKDNFNNDFLNLDVLINRYENNDIVEYSINNSQFMQVDYLEDYSVSQNIKYFTINNVNNNDLIIVRVKRNNSVITTARYRANYLKYSNSSNENFNINNIFNKINLNNINEELKNYIKQFGNLILNSKIGNLLLLQTFCLVITIIIKMIRN